MDNTNRPQKRQNNKAEKRAFLLLEQGLADALATSTKAPASVLIRCGNQPVFECDGIVNLGNQQRADFVFTLRTVPVVYITHKASNFSYNGYGRLWKKVWSERGRVVHPASAEAMIWTRDWCIKHCYDGKDREGLLDWAEPCREGIWFIPSPDLQRAMVYGAKYGCDELGPDNVHFLAIGDPKFGDQGDGTRKLDFPEGTYANGAIPAGSDTPIVVVRKAKDNDDNFYTNSSPLVGMRANFGYFPLRLVGPPVKSKVRGCVRVEYPSGRFVSEPIESMNLK